MIKFRDQSIFIKCPKNSYSLFFLNDYELDAIVTEDSVNGNLDSEPKNHKKGFSLGLGDLVFFNLMILFILHSIWSMTTKISVVFGCICV